MIPAAVNITRSVTIPDSGVSAVRDETIMTSSVNRNIFLS